MRGTKLLAILAVPPLVLLCCYGFLGLVGFLLEIDGFKEMLSINLFFLFLLPVTVGCWVTALWLGKVTVEQIRSSDTIYDVEYGDGRKLERVRIVVLTQNFAAFYEECGDSNTYIIPWGEIKRVVTVENEASATT